MAFVEDFAAFFDPETPGVVVATINGATVNGDLNADLDETLEVPTRSNAPQFSCAKADLPALAVGDVLTVDGTNYLVREVEVEEFDPVAILHLNNP